MKDDTGFFLLCCCGFSLSLNCEGECVRVFLCSIFGNRWRYEMVVGFWFLNPLRSGPVSLVLYFVLLTVVRYDSPRLEK